MTHSSDEAQLTVAEAGEAVVLNAILGALEGQHDTAWLRVGPGDDAAVVSLAGDLVITSDAMVHGPDFRLSWSTPREIGWKLAATNLSDVAAMGASPLGLTVTVMAPGETTVAFLEEIAHGLTEACHALAPGTRVVGGDLSTSQTLAFSVTAIGEMQGRAPVTRSGAKVGDIVTYAGDLGLAGAGLRLFATHCRGTVAEQAAVREQLWREHPAEIGAHVTPRPPVWLGPAAAEAGATAMMDVSDALSLDAARLGKASAVTLSLDAAALGPDIGMALTGGEDHGLLATFPSNSPIPEGFRVIGQVVARSAELLVDGEPFTPQGWDPFRHE